MKNTISKYRWRRWTFSRRGTTSVEYAVVLGLIVVACIGNLQTLGQNATVVFQRIAEFMSGSGGASGSPVAGTGDVR